MKFIDITVGIISFILWFVYIFTKDPIIQIILGMGLGFSLTRYVIKSFLEV